jgi:hypothetical protein
MKINAQRKEQREVKQESATRTEEMKRKEQQRGRQR